MGKWLELLTQIAPDVKRVAIMFNPDSAPYVEADYVYQFETAAGSLKVAPITAPVHSDVEIETAIIVAQERARRWSHRRARRLYECPSRDHHIASRPL
jgi:putative ABC transport system substrate-binding protein